MSNSKGTFRIEDLEKIRNKVKSDIATMSFYLEKINVDRARLKSMLAYYEENANYLRKHVGVINAEQYRKLKNNINKCLFFLKNANSDADQLEKNIDKCNKQLEQINNSIERWIANNACRVLNFSRNKEIANVDEGRPEKKDRDGSRFHLLPKLGELPRKADEEAPKRNLDREDGSSSNDNS